MKQSRICEYIGYSVLTWTKDACILYVQEVLSPPPPLCTTLDSLYNYSRENSVLTFLSFVIVFLCLKTILVVQTSKVFSLFL